VNEPAAVDYLLRNYPEWREIYDLFENHWAAMTILARDLSNVCGLTVYADHIWTGGGCMGLGMVFMGNSMGEENRTPEDDEKLKKLEQKLVELKLVTAPELDILCSASFRPHLEEPFHMRVMPCAKPFGGDEIFALVKHWRKENERLRQARKREVRQREKDDTETR